EHNVDAVFDSGSDETFDSSAAFAFGSTLQAFDTNKFESLLNVAVSFVEGFLDVHPAGTCTFTQCLNVFDCVIGHYRYFIPCKFVAGIERDSNTKIGCGPVLFGRL